MDYQSITESLGLKYEGTKELGGTNLVYFTDKLTGSTLAIEADKFTAKRVSKKVRDSRKEFMKVHKNG
jgi:hypothetical protein